MLNKSERKRCVIATTTFYKNINETRAQCALGSAEEARRLGYQLVVVDDSPDPRVKEELVSLGALVHKQRQPGMGASRRQAIGLAKEIAGPNGAWVFIEPEKKNVLKELEQSFSVVIHDNDVIVVLCRTASGLHTCDQAWEYISHLGSLNFKMATGLPELDVFLGTRVVSSKLAEFFEMERQGIPGDKSWGVTHYGMLDALAAGYKIVGIPINFVHPPEQKAAEDNPLIFMKRVVQTALLTAGSFLYAVQLGLMSADPELEKTCRNILVLE